jgi:hypothetical protein
VRHLSKLLYVTRCFLLVPLTDSVLRKTADHQRKMHSRKINKSVPTGFTRICLWQMQTIYTKAYTRISIPLNSSGLLNKILRDAHYLFMLVLQGCLCGYILRFFKCINLSILLFNLKRQALIKILNFYAIRIRPRI